MIDLTSKLRVLLGKPYWYLRALNHRVGNLYCLEVNYKKKKFNIFGSNYHNIVLVTNEVFKEEQYNWLDVKGRVVYDVGAFLGDSGIYFSLKGAKKVICFEPYFAKYKLAIKNCKPFKNIDVKNAAIGGENKKILLSSGENSTIGSDLSNSGNTEVAMLSLDTISKDYDAILKLDCEGSEYDIIINAKKQTLQKYYQIQIEYHKGVNVKEIEQKLKSARFNVNVSSDKNGIGWIYAVRI
jgi:FkbM family methyltransferase